MQEVKLKPCKVCGSKFKPFKSTDRHCSWTCAKEDGKLGLPQNVNIDYELKDWSKAVRVRDKYICQMKKPHSCSKTKDAHHIKKKGTYPQFKYDLDNGITLCHNAHMWVHDHPKEAFDLGLLYVAKYAAQMV